MNRLLNVALAILSAAAVILPVPMLLWAMLTPQTCFAQEAPKVLLVADLPNGVHFKVLEPRCTLQGEVIAESRVLVVEYRGKSRMGCIAVMEGEPTAFFEDSEGITILPLIGVHFTQPMEV